MTEASRVHADAVGDAIRATAEVLGPWVGQRVGVWPSDRRGRTSPHDPSYLVGVILDGWMGTFRDALGEGNLAQVHRYRDLRNRWAHNDPLDADDAVQARQVAERLLAAIGATYQSAPPAAPQSSTGAEPGHRQARSAEFRSVQWEQRFAPHVAPVNQLVDALIVERPGAWMPYVAAYHGGIDAEIVLLYQDPGPMTVTANGGSGFIGCENDDPTAELLAVCLDDAEVTQRQVIPWNSYPWFLPDQKGVSATRRREGLDPLQRLLALLPAVHTVVTGGAVAHDTWDRLAKANPSLTSSYRALSTFHTSRRGITNGGQQSRQDGIAHVVDTLREAADDDRDEADCGPVLRRCGRLVDRPARGGANDGVQRWLTM